MPTVLSDNLKEESLIARRIITERVQKTGGVEKVPLTGELLLSCRNDFRVWQEKSKNRKEEAGNKESAVTEKRRINQKISEVQQKRLKVVHSKLMIFPFLLKDFFNIKGKGHFY